MNVAAIFALLPPPPFLPPWDGTLIQKANVALAQRVWHLIQRIVTIVVTLACDLLSQHDKYLTVVFGLLEQNWETVGNGWELCVFLANFPYLSPLWDINIFAAFKHNRWRGCLCSKQVTKIKSQGAREQFRILRVLYYLAFRLCTEVGKRNAQSLFVCFFLLLFVVFDLGCLCWWPACGRDRDTHTH